MKVRYKSIQWSVERVVFTSGIIVLMREGQYKMAVKYDEVEVI